MKKNVLIPTDSSRTNRNSELLAEDFTFSFPAHIKAVIDQMHAFFMGKEDIGMEECVWTVCENTVERSDLERIVRSYASVTIRQKFFQTFIEFIFRINKSPDYEQKAFLPFSDILFPRLSMATLTRSSFTTRGPTISVSNQMNTITVSPIQPHLNVSNSLLRL